MPSNIRAELARRSLSQKALAEHMGITQQALSHKLRGLRPIHVTELEVIAEYLDVDASTLLDRRAS